MNQATLIEVLRPQPLETIALAKPAAVPAGSLADRVIEAGAATLRSIYLAGKRRTDSVENFWDACADTDRALHELVDALPDEHTRSLTCTLIERAGFTRSNLHPTTLRAQVEMQFVAVDVARNARNFLAQQQSFNLGA